MKSFRNRRETVWMRFARKPLFIKRLLGQVVLEQVAGALHVRNVLAFAQAGE
jgi:hypothetical protein